MGANHIVETGEAFWGRIRNSSNVLHVDGLQSILSAMCSDLFCAQWRRANGILVWRCDKRLDAIAGRAICADFAFRGRSGHGAWEAMTEAKNVSYKQASAGTFLSTQAIIFTLYLIEENLSTETRPYRNAIEELPNHFSMVVLGHKCWQITLLSPRCQVELGLSSEVAK